MKNSTFGLLEKAIGLVIESHAMKGGSLVVLDAEKEKVTNDIIKKFCMETAWKLYQNQQIAENDAELQSMADEISFEELNANPSQMSTDSELPNATPAAAAPAGLPESAGFDSLFAEDMNGLDMNTLFSLPEDDPMGGQDDNMATDPSALPDDGMGGMHNAAAGGDEMTPMGGDDLAGAGDAPPVGGDDLAGLGDAGGDDGFEFDASLADALKAAADALSGVADQIGGSADAEPDMGAPAPGAEEQPAGEASDPSMGSDTGLDMDMGDTDTGTMPGEEPVEEEKMKIVPAGRRASAARPMGK